MSDRKSRKQRAKRTARVRRGQGSVALSREEFAQRFLERFRDPAFEEVSDALEEVLEVAWAAYREDRKAPRTRRAGAGYHDPDFDLPVEWLETRRAIEQAERRRRSRRSRSRVLIVCGSPRSDQSCPGEMSKTWRLVQTARRAIETARGFETDVLDLSHLASEYGRVIHPCKACVSTAMPLCHWPCSCYPNHGQGQTGDWMNEIYPRFAAAHGVVIVTPVHWYQAPSALKLMMDRLVCADGGNPDPTRTKGKDPALAKALELSGWDYPRHLAGRAFSVVVHGDAAGVGALEDALSNWLTDMGLVPAGRVARLARYIGYMAPYATSHDDLDRERDLQREVRAAMEGLVEMVRLLRAGKCPSPAREVEVPRPK
jgi:multimeric flavodoxin WrbA